MMYMILCLVSMSYFVDGAPPLTPPSPPPHHPHLVTDIPGLVPNEHIDPSDKTLFIYKKERPCLLPPWGMCGTFVNRYAKEHITMAKCCDMCQDLGSHIVDYARKCKNDCWTTHYWIQCTLDMPTCGQKNEFTNMKYWGRAHMEWWWNVGRHDPAYNYWTELEKEDKRLGCIRPFTFPRNFTK